MTLTREEIQDDCIGHWIENNCRTIVNIGTGVGKSLILIRAIDYALKGDSLSKALIVAHTEESRDVTLPDEFKKWGKEDLLLRCDIVCYASLKNIKEDYTIAAFDEAHYLTENNSQFLYTNTPQKLIFLTATLPSEQEKLDIIFDFAEARYSLHVDKAIKENILNDYKLHVVYVDLDDQKLNTRPYKTKGWMTEKKAYNDVSRKIEFFQNSGQYKLAEMMRLKRMHLLYDSDSKLQAAIKAKKVFTNKNKRFIMFCGSTKMADKLSNYTYHSKSSRKSYESFINGSVNELASVKKIKEGANIPELDGAIIVQLNSKELNITQMIGRLLRGKVGTTKPIIVIVVRDSIDMVWFQKATLNFDQSKISELVL